MAVLDFASLYPSIMRAHNLSPDTFVRPSDVARFRALGVPMTEIDVKDTPRVHHFVSPNTMLDGFIPTIAAHLLSMRSSVKRQMKVEEDPSVRAILDGKQKALKASVLFCVLLFYSPESHLSHRSCAIRYME